MTRILVNALSLGSLSGRHVLLGHVKQLAKQASDRCEVVLLHRGDHGPLMRETLPDPNVELVAAPKAASRWASRSFWESTQLPRLIRSRAIDKYFTPAGTILPRCPVPQVSLAQNPWCLVREVHRGWTERAKARLQRSAYRQAYAQAECMVFNSHHIQQLYARNAAPMKPRATCLAYQGIDDATHEAAQQTLPLEARDRWTIVSISVMAHWKGAETLVAAVAELRRRGLPARLRLIGPWPEASYQRVVRQQVRQLGLENAVEIAGKVDAETLRTAYKTAHVFCLMSACESFGIPAIEAQAFGTPVVGSDHCAMAEIGGQGGLYGPPREVAGTADLLQQVMLDESRWQQLHEAARQNAARFRWSECSKPLIEVLTGAAVQPPKALAVL